MFFGEEGERLQQQRAAAQRQYAEDLRQQMEERQRHPFTPSEAPNRQTYNPQSNDYSQPSNQYNQQSSTFNQQQNQYAPVNSRINNQQTLRQPNPQTRPNVVQPRPAESRSRGQSPRITEPLPDLPPSGPSPDAIRFADRLNWLESSVDQHQQILKSASDASSRIEHQAIPSLQGGIEQLRSALERVANVDLPGRLRPIEEENAHMEEKISNATTEYTNVSQSLRERLNQMASVLSQTESQFNELNDNAKSTITQLRSEIGAARDQADSTAQRISQAESHASTVEENLRSVTSSLSAFEKSATEGISAALSSTNSAVSQAALQVAQALKAESDTRDQASGVLHSQTEEVNQRAGQAVSQVQTSINELAVSFNQSLTALSSSVKDALEQTRSDSDQSYKDLSARLDALVSDTENNFSTVQNESVQTLQALNEHATKARESLEQALTAECNARKQNELQIVQHYDNFKSIIVNEMQLQTAQMEEASSQATQRVVKVCNDAVLPLKAEVREVREKTRSMENIPSRVQQVEALINQLNQQLVENIAALSQQSSQIVNTLDKVRSESESSIDNIGERVALLEQNAAKPDYATRSDVQEAFSRLNMDFDGRMQEIEQQIGVIFSSLSDLTMSTPAAAVVHEPGAALIDQLATE